MENDDDTFVVIIGDDIEWVNGEEDVELPKPLQIKQECEEVTELPTEVSVENILEVASKVGEYIEFEVPPSEEYKTEPPEYLDAEYLGEDIESSYAYLEGYDYDEAQYFFPDGGITENDTDEYHTDSDSGSKRRKAEFRKSFVEDLRREYPELRGDDSKLIKTLVGIMKAVKRPPPPKDYFVMNDVLFECVKCGAVSESEPAAWRHWQEKHGKRYLVCYACGVDFRSCTNLYKHEKRCNAKDAIIVLKARAIFLGRKGRSRPFLGLAKNALIENVFAAERRQEGRISRERSRSPVIIEYLGDSPGRRSGMSRERSRSPVIIADLSELYLPRKKPSTYVKKSFPCTMCSAVFNSKNNLQSHENLHRGERPFRCHQCPCAYTSFSALTRHLQKHKNETFICDYCQRPFNTKPTLIAHLDTHSLMRKFGCNLCDKRYAQKAALKLHVSRVHLNLPPPCACQICPKRYPRMSLLKQHMKAAHGMTLMTRKMFFKSLPTLTDTQLQQAKLVLKSEVTITTDVKMEPIDIDELVDMDHTINLNSMNEEDIFPVKLIKRLS